MNFKFDNERPIYIQLIEQLKSDIISGKLSPGERIPSVRELAIKLKVNPNTIQKALQNLEENNFIFTERTTGKYVTKNKKLIERNQEKYAMEKINAFIHEMNNLGITKKEIIKLLKEEGEE